LPELTPTSPEMVVSPVFVIVSPPKTEKLSASPSVGEVAYNWRADTLGNIPAIARNIIKMIETANVLFIFIVELLLK